MGNDRPFEQARNFKFGRPQDHRRPWHHSKSRVPEQDELVELLRAYLAVHGDWREVTANGEHFWEFEICECEICKIAGEVVDHPETP